MPLTVEQRISLAASAAEERDLTPEELRDRFGLVASTTADPAYPGLVLYDVPKRGCMYSTLPMPKDWVEPPKRPLAWRYRLRLALDRWLDRNLYKLNDQGEY